MKRCISIVLVLVMLAGMLTGCGSQTSTNQPENSSKSAAPNGETGKKEDVKIVVTPQLIYWMIL